MAAVETIKKAALRCQQQVQLGQLAEHIGATLKDGEPALVVHGMASLQHAQPGSVSFFDNHSHRRHLQHTNASAVIVRQDDLPLCPVPALLVAEPRQAYVKAMLYLYPNDMSAVASGVAVTASVDESVELAQDVTIGHGTVVEADAVLGAGAYIGPLCHIGAGVRIGAGSRLLGRVTLLSGTVLGERAIIHPGVVIGADGFGFVRCGEGGIAVKVPQIGGVCIGRDVEIGANSTIDCGTMEDTVIADSVKLDAQVHIGHNVCIGTGAIISGGVRIGGSTVIGARCLVGGAALLSDNISIADDVVITGASRIPRAITRQHSIVGDWGVSQSKFRRNNSISSYDLLRRIRSIEGRLR
ncbi:MAG: UDP-3-O-(3-hydroxymyristoyl)glucosamine N-acyltransferase [Candidatus Porifericomitaceae bacterium WSBS_2022_MAG_OTU9]